MAVIMQISADIFSFAAVRTTTAEDAYRACSLASKRVEWMLL